jgi:hypothetical protein
VTAARGTATAKEAAVARQTPTNATVLPGAPNPLLTESIAPQAPINKVAPLGVREDTPKGYVEDLGLQEGKNKDDEIHQ